MFLNHDHCTRTGEAPGDSKESKASRVGASRGNLGQDLRLTWAAITCPNCFLGLADDYVTTKLSLQSPKSRVGVSRENLDHHDEDLCRGWHSPAWIALWALRMIALPQRNYAEEATKVAQKQYSSLLEGLRAVGQVKGWQKQQIVFVGGTCVWISSC